MRQANIQSLFTAEDTTANGTKIDASQLFAISVQAVSTGTSTGTVKMQMSNDMPLNGDMTPFTPTHWSDIASQTTSLTVAGSYLISKFDLCYQWVRPVFTFTGNGTQTITTVADETAVAQVSKVVTVADVAGSLNSTYFLLSNANNAINYYVWFNINSAGVDPAIAGKTGIAVAGATNASANALAAAINTAINLLGVSFTSIVSTNNVTITNVATGPSTVAVDGAAPTGFTITTPTPGFTAGTVFLNNTYFYINDSLADGAVAYYAWINVGGGGTDPMILGKTGIEVDIAKHATASAVATALATALQGAMAATAAPASAVVTVTNTSAGTFVPAVNVSTGFTFAITQGAGTVTVRLKSLGF